MAPILSDIFLADVDRDIERSLCNTKVKKVVRYVDDFVVFHEDYNGRGGTGTSVDEVMAVFEECGGGFRFTVEVPKGEVLQYLDLSLRSSEGHMCWCYSPR